MNVNTVNLLRSLDEYSHNSSVLGSLKGNERLWGTGHKFSKNSAPDAILKGSKNPFLRVIRQVIKVTLKIFQAIGRGVTGQKVERNIKKVEVLTNNILELLKQDFPKDDQPEYYHALQKLGRIRTSLINAKGTGLVNYKKTCEEGLASLIRDKKKVRTQRGAEVQEIMDQIKGKVLTQLKAKIDEMETKTLKKDKDVIDKLSSKSLEKTFFTNRAAKKFLCERFGGATVDRALEYYQLQEARVLSGTDFIALSTGIVANLTYEDLFEIYCNKQKSIAQSEKGSAMAVSLNLVGFTDENYDMLMKQDFSNLSEEDKCMDLAEVRNFNYGVVTPHKKMKYFKQLKHDQGLLRCLARNEEVADGKEFKVGNLTSSYYTKYLARDFLLTLFDGSKSQFPQGLLLSYYDTNGKVRLGSASTMIAGKLTYGIRIEPVMATNGNEELIILKGRVIQPQQM